MQTNIDTKVVERIQKLLALAHPDGGATEAEMNLAMEKAQEIMRDNNLSMAMIDASGGKSEGRAKEETKKNALYPYQRNLMTALCDTNYCHVTVSYKAAARRSLNAKYRTFPAGYQIIGRESNVVLVRVMFDYLIKTINRLVLEELGGDHTKRMSNWAMSWCDGCSTRLVERIKAQYDKILHEQKIEAEQKRKEYETRSKHPGAAPQSNGNALIVILEDHAQSERDLNEDFRNGRAPGTTARQRAEQKAARKKAIADAIADGVTDKDVLSWMEYGYTREQAEKMVDRNKIEEEIEVKVKKKETDAQRRKREEREARARERSRHRYWREQSKRNPEGYRSGTAAGDKISLHQQIDNRKDPKIGG